MAVSIPIFSSQLEKAREAVDLSNVRSAYSIVQASWMTFDGPDGRGTPENSSMYFYTSSGTFKRFIVGGPNDGSSAYKLKSKSVELPDFISINDAYGWKDCAIMVTYYEDIPYMYTYPVQNIK